MKKTTAISETAQGNNTEIVKSDQALSFENAWIRPAPPGVQSMAAYFDLVNNTDQDLVINSSSSTAFEMTMIHTTLVEDGIASMEHLEQLLVPANGRVSLAPLGIHMMLMHPKQELALGDSTEITLSSLDGAEYKHVISVKPQADN